MSIYNNLDEMKLTAVHLSKKHHCNYNIIIMNHVDGAFNENGGSTYEMVRDSYFETERSNIVKLFDTDELIEKEVELMRNRSELFHFMSENYKSGQLDKETSDKIELLWNEYKEPKIDTSCAVISTDVGLLGSVIIKNISSVDEEKILKYQDGKYDYVSVKIESERVILWTDYSKEEPYNRHGGLYAEGSSFESLGSSVIEKETYREFVKDRKTKFSCSFAIWGFGYNNFYGSVRFGMCIKKERVDEFIIKLRTILDK